MKEFSHRTRLANLKKLTQEHFDLVIVGGGINGAGVARDAALRGLRVALIEACDFASGTSSRSSKLIHGGIRYLENFEFALVFEALTERQKLIELAPHLVHPIRFLIPLYKGGRVGMGLMGLGMWAYDALSLFQAPELHERLSVSEALTRVPFLRQEGLLGAYEYSDAYMDDDRLVIETIRSANEAGAICVNYLKATGLELEQGKITAIKAVAANSKEAFSIRGDRFLSTVGPWTDELAKTFFPQWEPILRPTKGVHLTFDRQRLPLEKAVVMAAEKRIVFAIPRHEMVIVGTTDTDFKQDPRAVLTERSDVDYLLQVLAEYYPKAQLTEADIVSCYAGVRPLVHDGASSEGKTSREHTIFTDEHDLTYVAGGKYTTYRLIAEQTLDHILNQLPFERRASIGPCRTEQALNRLASIETLNHLSAIVDELRIKSLLTLDEANSLASRHAEEAQEIQKRFGKDKNMVELEALHAIHSCMCVNLVDFFTRRVPYFLSHKDHGRSDWKRIAEVFQSELSWTDSEKAKQLAEMESFEKREFAWRTSVG